MVIGIDFDGCLADPMPFLSRALADLGHRVPLRPEVYGLEEYCPRQAVREAVARLTENYWPPAELPPLPHAPAVLRALCRRHRVHVVTARPKAKPVVWWLWDVVGYDADVLVTHTGGDYVNHGKADACRRLQVDWYVEDRLETALELDDAGVPTLLFAQPWNRDNRGRLPEVSSWRDLARLFL